MASSATEKKRVRQKSVIRCEFGFRRPTPPAQLSRAVKADEIKGVVEPTQPLASCLIIQKQLRG